MSGIANFQIYPTKTSCGSAHFMAPEMKTGQRYDEKIDIWSFGVALYEHLLGQKFYKYQVGKNSIPQPGLLKKELDEL